MKDNVVPMPSSMVLVRGTLRGMGHKAACELLMRKQRTSGRERSGARTFQYTEWTILQAPPNLPDGEYVVTTEDGFSFAATRMNGLWVRGQAGARRAKSRETA